MGKKKPSAWTLAAREAQQIRVEQGDESEKLQNGRIVKLTEKFTVYLSWDQMDKLNDMVAGYQKRKQKRIDVNKMLRLMIDEASLDDLIGSEESDV